jgi:large subunit ribosomal protein L29
MKTTELREMTIDELQMREGELSEEVARMRLQLALKRLDNPLKMRVIKRDLARVKTILNERGRKGEKPTARPTAAKPAAAPKKPATKPAEPAGPAEAPDKA